MSILLATQRLTGNIIHPEDYCMLSKGVNEEGFKYSRNPLGYLVIHFSRIIHSGGKDSSVNIAV